MSTVCRQLHTISVQLKMACKVQFSLFPLLFLPILDKLRESVRKFADEQLAPIAAEIDANNDIPQMKEVWKKLGDMGLLGITAPGVRGKGGGVEGGKRRGKGEGELHDGQWCWRDKRV